jgi:hypothetical protein
MPERSSYRSEADLTDYPRIRAIAGDFLTHARNLKRQMEAGKEPAATTTSYVKKPSRDLGGNTPDGRSYHLLSPESLEGVSYNQAMYAYRAFDLLSREIRRDRLVSPLIASIERGIGKLAAVFR